MTAIDCLQSIQDSIETAVSLKIFSSKKTASYAHIFESKLFSFPLAKADELENFNPARLSENPYPKDDRPRGQKDLDSVNYHRKQIKKGLPVEPIWLIKKNEKLILLDGVHRIVAFYLENKRSIPAYLIQSS